MGVHLRRPHGAVLALNDADVRHLSPLTVAGLEGFTRVASHFAVADLDGRISGFLIDSGVIGTTNVNVLDDQDSLPGTAEPMIYEGESVEDRTARRVRAWTPVTPHM